MNRYLLVLFSLLLFLNCENKKRYDKNLTPFQKEMNKFIDKKIKLLGGKIGCKVIEFKENTGIIRVDHQLLAEARKIMNQESGSIEIKTMKSSGTLKSLKKY